MFRTAVRCLAVAITLVIGAASAAQAGAPYAPDRVIVKFKDPTGAGRVAPLPAGASAAVERRFRMGAQVLRISGMTVEDAVAHFAADPFVEYAEPDYIVTIDQTDQKIPNDPRLGELYGLDNSGQTGGTPDADIDAPEAWTIQTGGDVLIGVIDTGVDYRHEDLAANMWTNPGEIPGNGVDDDNNGFVDDVHGWDFVNGDNDPMDDNKHGTHVAGTIAAVGDNGIGVAGVCWRARLMAIKVLDRGGRGTMSMVIAGVEYAMLMGARITNNSWGSTDFSQALDDVLAANSDGNTVFIAAAGNIARSNDFFPYYPASYPYENIIAVANTDHDDELYVTSNYGAESVDLSAPGSFILSLMPSNRYGVLSGTSMATPHVAGAVGLILAEAPLMTPRQVKELLMSTVDPVPSLQGKTVSRGRLNVHRALLALDDTAPARVDDLKVARTGSNTVTLTWTASGDDGGAGTAAVNDIRYAESPIKPWTFDLATPVEACPSPAPAGTRETFRVDGLDVKTTYFFAMRVMDERLNASEMSKVVAGRTRGAPEVSFAPASFAGEALTGAAVSRTMRITNNGKGSVDFAFAAGGNGWARAEPGAGAVDARQTVEVSVRLDALGLPGGEYDDVLTLTTNDPSMPAVEVPVHLSVTSAPHLVIAEGGVDFGGWFVGAQTRREVHLANRGDRTLAVAAVELVDADEAFAVNVAPFSLAPSAERAIAVDFAPAAPRDANATLRITSDDPDDAVAAVALVGRGLPPPDIRVAPAQLATQLHSGATSTHTLTIANDGAADLEWEVSVVGDANVPSRGGVAAASFRDLTGVRVLYDAAHLNLHWYNYNTMFADLRSRGAEIVVSSSEFSQEYLGGFDVVWMAESFIPVAPRERDALVAWVRAGGGLLLEGDYDDTLPTFNGILRALWSGIELSGENGTTGITNNIEPHETTRDVSNVFLSRVTATLGMVRRPAAVLIYDVEGKPNSAWSRAGAGRLVMMADQNLANHRMGRTGNLTLGNRVIDWLARGVPWLQVTPSGGVLAPGEETKLDVAVDATGLAGAFETRIVVGSNDPDEPELARPVMLDATPAPDIAVGADALEFARTAVERWRQRDLSIGNIGAADLEVTGVSISDGVFTATPSAFTIPPGGTVTLTVTYTPANEGDDVAALTLYSDDPDEGDKTIDLAGHGFIGTPGAVTIVTRPGLNLVSWNIDPLNDAPEVVLADILPGLVRVVGVEDGHERIFDPADPDQPHPLERLDHLRAYRVEVSQPGEVTIEGFIVDAQTPIPLLEGWNTISYLPTEPDAPAHALASIVKNLDMVYGYEDEWLTYSPRVPEEENTLRELKPTFGYWVKMLRADTLVYSDTTTAVAANKRSHGPDAEPTLVSPHAPLPQRTALHQNFPNPFNPSTTIKYDLAGTGRVTIVVYNLRGQLVRTLVDGVKGPGTHAVSWDGTNATGAPVATGVYFYRLVAGDFTQTRKMVLVK